MADTMATPKDHPSMTHGLEPLLVWLRTVLPAGFGVSGGPIGEPAPSLYPVEEAVVAKAVARRRFEFRAGRSYAREALLQIGCAATPIDRGEAGAPVWPAGYVGSISHSDGLAVGVAARSQAYAGLGVDLTSVAALEADLARVICRAGELRGAQGAAWNGADPAKRIFAAKEASVKALYAATGVALDFLDLEIAFSAGGDEFIANGVSAAPARRLCDPRLFRGHIGRADKTLLAVSYIAAAYSA